MKKLILVVSLLASSGVVFGMGGGPGNDVYRDKRLQRFDELRAREGDPVSRRPEPRNIPDYGDDDVDTKYTYDTYNGDECPCLDNCLKYIFSFAAHGADER